MDKLRVSNILKTRIHFFAGLLTLSAVVSILHSHASFIASGRGEHVQLPLHAQEILATCAALKLRPGPPANFHERTRSDRFQFGVKPLLIQNATLWTGLLDGFDVVQGDLYLDQGLIRALGQVDVVTVGREVEVIDANGAWVTPGIIDIHSHLAVESLPALEGASDGNSLKGIAQPWLRSIDALNTHDEGFKHSMAGGVTSSLILPGSANAIGGQAFVMKLRPTKERSPISMLLEPPYDLNGSDVDPALPPRWRYMKHACGENPSRVYSGTRMDTAWALRSAYERARHIMVAQDDYCAKAMAGEWSILSGQSFPEELQWEAVVDVLRGRVKVNTHCYEAVDFDGFVRLSTEFKFPVAAFHHAHEAYLVPDLLKSAHNQTPAIAMFSSFSRYKREAYRHSEFAPRILAEHGVPVIMKSDHPAIQSRFLVNEAGYAHYYGLPENIALASVTSTPATTLGLDHRIGFLKEGYDADVVIWDSHPLSLGSAPAQVIIDGLPQINPAYPAVKPERSQRVPNTPNWDEETKTTLSYDGLPPLEPAISTKSTVLFTNVSSAWLHSQESSDIADLLATTEDTGLVVVRAGRVVCSGSLQHCTSYTSISECVRIDLKGGSLQPGLISPGSSIGLQEIAMESSTADSVAFDPLAADVPTIAGGTGYMPRAVDGLQFGSRDALLAYRHGVTVAVSAPIHSSFLGGVSAAFSLGSPHKLEEGAIVQDVAAVHVKLVPGGISSVSTQIATLRRLLLDPTGKAPRYLQLVAQGTLPLVVEADSADIIATIIQLKLEVETEMGFLLRVVISGGGESHILAEELAEASIGVILKPPRPYPLQWDHRRYLPGPPASAESTIGTLLEHNVTVALGPQGVTNEDFMHTWAVRNLRFDAAWAQLEAPDIVDKASAIALVSSNAAKLLGLNIAPGDEDLVATIGGDLLSFEGKVAAIISPRRSTVDIL